jgi:hypothetical protein
MTKETPRTDLEDQEAEFVRRIAQASAPPELTPSKRAAIDAKLWARVENRRRFGFLTPALATSAVAVVVIAVVRVTGMEETRVASLPSPVQKTIATDSGRTPATWEYSLLFEPAINDGTDGEQLPEEYRAIADLLLEG